MMSIVVYIFIGGYQQIRYVKNIKYQLQQKLLHNQVDRKQLFAKPENFFSLILLMRDRLAKYPDDKKGWQMLSKLYANAQDQRNAKIALERSQ